MSGFFKRLMIFVVAMLGLFYVSHYFAGRRADVKDTHDTVTDTVTDTISIIPAARDNYDRLFDIDWLKQQVGDCSRFTTMESIAVFTNAKDHGLYANVMKADPYLPQYICKTAINTSLSPSRKAMDTKIYQYETVQLTLSQVSHVMANIFMGSNLGHQTDCNADNLGIITNCVHGNIHDADYKSGPLGYQYLNFLSAMNIWRQRDISTDKTLVIYGGFMNSMSSLPESSTGSADIDYTCTNRAIHNPEPGTNGVIRTLDGGNVPCGSFFGGIDGTTGANEETFCALFPEVFVGAMFLPGPATSGYIPKSPNKVYMSWFVLGTDPYIKYDSSELTTVRTYGGSADNSVFADIGDYKISISGMLSLAGNPLPCQASGLSNFTCDKAWTLQHGGHDKTDAILNNYYTKIQPTFNTSMWPNGLLELTNEMKLETGTPVPFKGWNFVGGRWGSGDWFCNPTYSLNLQGLAAVSGNAFNHISLCKSHSEPSLYTQACVCSMGQFTRDGDWYSKQYTALKSPIFNDQNIWSDCNKYPPTTNDPTNGTAKTEITLEMSNNVVPEPDDDAPLFVKLLNALNQYIE